MRDSPLAAPLITGLADFDILQSKSRPEYLKFSQVQTYSKIYEMWSPSPNKVQQNTDF